ncbi:MAG: hypothetical protein AAF197_10525, partial [Pseudomonadota bacterium]
MAISGMQRADSVAILLGHVLIICVAVWVLLAPVPSFSQTICGPSNYGPHPVTPYWFCEGERVTRYDHCGKAVGSLTGVRSDPFYCELANWQPDPLTVRHCSGTFFERCTQQGSTKRCRKEYSRNKGWSWSPKANTQCKGKTFTQ